MSSVGNARPELGGGAQSITVATPRSRITPRSRSLSEERPSARNSRRNGCAGRRGEIAADVTEVDGAVEHHLAIRMIDGAGVEPPGRVLWVGKLTRRSVARGPRDTEATS